MLRLGRWALLLIVLVAEGGLIGCQPRKPTPVVREEGTAARVVQQASDLVPAATGLIIARS